MESRVARVQRETRETSLSISIDLDGSGEYQIETGVPFLDHMLSHVAVHGMLDAQIAARGDIEVDDHHTVEDVGIGLGTALRQAVGDKRGIRRYGHCILPMDEALAMVSLDFSGRGICVCDVQFTSAKIGRFDSELVVEFLRALATNAGITLHVRLLAGANSHHIAEAIFKALGRALRQAVEMDPRQGNIPSTKGAL